VSAAAAPRSGRRGGGRENVEAAEGDQVVAAHDGGDVDTGGEELSRGLGPVLGAPPVVLIVSAV
jgi:hypothetical protein